MSGCPLKPHPLLARRTLGSLKRLLLVSLGPPTTQNCSLLLLKIPAPWGQGLTVTELGAGDREVGVLRLLPVVANSMCQLDGAQGRPGGW